MRMMLIAVHYPKATSYEPIGFRLFDADSNRKVDKLCESVVQLLSQGCDIEGLAISPLGGVVSDKSSFKRYPRIINSKETCTDRFTVVEEIVGESGTPLGYKLANCSGEVRDIRASDIIKHKLNLSNADIVGRSGQPEAKIVSLYGKFTRRMIGNSESKQEKTTSENIPDSSLKNNTNYVEKVEKPVQAEPAGKVEKPVQAEQKDKSKQLLNSTEAPVDRAKKSSTDEKAREDRNKALADKVRARREKLLASSEPNKNIEKHNKTLDKEILDKIADEKSINTQGSKRTYTGSYRAENRIITDGSVDPELINMIDEKTGLSVQDKVIYALLAIKETRLFYYNILSLLNRKCTLQRKTFAVTTKTLYFNPYFVLKCKPSAIIFTLLHECSHLIMKHHLRMKNRDREAWNFATDYYINESLLQEFSMYRSPDLVTPIYKGTANDRVKSKYGISVPDGILLNPEIDLAVDTPEKLYDELLAKKNQRNEEEQQQGEQGGGYGNEEQSEQGAGGQSGQGESGDGKGKSNRNTGGNQGKQGGNEQEDGNGQGNNGGEQEASGQDSQSSQSSQSESGDSNEGPSSDSSEASSGEDAKEDDNLDGEKPDWGNEYDGTGGEDSDGDGAFGDDEPDDSEDMDDVDLDDEEQGKGASENDLEDSDEDSDTLGDEDYSTNQRDGSGTLIGTEFRGKEIPDSTGDDLVEDNETAGESDEVKSMDIDSLIQRAATITKYQTGSLFGSGDSAGFLERYVIDTMAPKVNWVKLLSSKLNKASQTVNTYAAPDKRFRARGMIVPGPKKIEDDMLDGVKICIDTSGSITNEVLGEALNQVGDLLKKFKAKAELMYWDTRVRDVIPFESLKDIDTTKAFGGGGTNPNCIFEYFETERDYRIGKRTKPSLIVIFTDGFFGGVDLKYKKYDTIWVIKNNPNFKAPFGAIGKILNR